MTDKKTTMTREEALDIARDYLGEKLKPEKSDGAKEDYDQFYKSGNNVNFSNGIYKGCKIRLDRNRHFADFYNDATLSDDEVDEWNSIVDEVVNSDESKNWKSFEYRNASQKQSQKQSKKQIIKASEITEYTREEVIILLDDFLGLYKKIVFVSKGERLPRLFFKQPHRIWTQGELADAAGMTKAYASIILHRMMENEYVKQEGNGYRLVNREKMLDDWRNVCIASTSK